MNEICWWKWFKILIIWCWTSLKKSLKFKLPINQTCNISRTLVGNTILDRSAVVGASRYFNYIFILYLTPGFNGLDKDSCKTRRETFKVWHLMSSHIRGLLVNACLTLNLPGGCMTWLCVSIVLMNNPLSWQFRIYIFIHMGKFRCLYWCWLRKEPDFNSNKCFSNLTDVKDSVLAYPHFPLQYIVTNIWNYGTKWKKS